MAGLANHGVDGDLLLAELRVGAFSVGGLVAAAVRSQPYKQHEVKPHQLQQLPRLHGTHTMGTWQSGATVQRCNCSSIGEVEGNPTDRASAGVDRRRSRLAAAGKLNR